jgi:hypothetical protein
MDNAIYEYIKNGITINGNPIDGYTVFTIPTQHFKIDNLDELTKWTFENEIRKQKEHDELTSEIFKEVQKEIDQEILNQLRGGEPNPDFIPMNTTDRLFHKFLDAPDPDADPDVIWGKNQFVNMLLTDDDFYQKWGENCCEELTYEERYKYWFSHNYETGFEYTPTIEPDFDNDYFEPTPKRKLK